jgi:hypothetical protein
MAQQGPRLAAGEPPEQAVPLFAGEIAAGADLAGPEAAQVSIVPPAKNE